jgi:hypothetical protein
MGWAHSMNGVVEGRMYVVSGKAKGKRLLGSTRHWWIIIRWLLER